MALKIGVISPVLPRALSNFAQKDSCWLWFNEIEAGFAYLLSDKLDKLVIDRRLVEHSHLYAQKYQILIEQLHPRLEISVVSFETFSQNPFVGDILHFPMLDILFGHGELKTVFQPIIECDEDMVRIHGIECLSRIKYNGQNYAPEFIFNYAAEKLKLTSYDRICLRQALSLIPSNYDSLIFINVRPQTLVAEDFTGWLKQLLKLEKLLPEQIVIEVTEQYCNISEPEMIAQCSTLKKEGLRLAIDDFGAGISNLSMLEVMQPSYIKISGRFIKNSHQDLNKQKIIKNVMALAQDFGIIPIVENVESEPEWMQLRILGARLAQGFYFYKPMTKEDLYSVLQGSVAPA